ncbi:MAG: BMC domain-containing protein [Deltaproteobacteria bacterium]|nr:BMC domain-containing protein [Deltaproteobacteria bacterium]
MGEPPALGLIEFRSIAAGTRACDALIKKAPVRVIRLGSLQPGKFAVLFSGGVAEVDQSFAEALRVGAAAVIDEVMLPQVERSVYAAVLGHRGGWGAETLGIIETDTLAATVEAADAAVKGASVRVTEIRLGDGLGGKGLCHFAGPQADVEAALAIGGERARRRPGREVTTSIMPRWDEDLRAALRRSTRFAPKEKG